MHYLYKILNTKSGSVYFGVTNDVYQRWAAHKSAALKKDIKSPLYCAIRSYGADVFSIEVLQEFSSREEAYSAEVAVIAKCKEEKVKTYNLHPGGTGGFSMLEKSPEEVEQWKARQRVARVGKTPALGMKHSDENKRLFSMYGKLRWDLYGRYPVEEIICLRCVDAMRKYGISKTHYYRLRKQLVTNDNE